MASAAGDAKIPFTAFYNAARKAEKLTIVRRSLCNGCMLLLAMATGSWVLPVGEIWDVHDALLSHFRAFSRNSRRKLMAAGAGALLALEDVASADDAWSWLHHTLWPLLFPATNASAANGTGAFTPWYNQPLGAVRLRQVRVLPQHCPKLDSAAASSGACWPDFEDNLQSSMLLPDRRPWRTSPLISDTLLTGLPAISGEGHHGSSYGSRAQVLDIPMNCETGAAGSTAVVEALAQVGANCSDLLPHLRQHAWIDEASRMFSVELSVRNANYDLWTYVRFQFDLSALGRVQTSLHLRSLRLRPHFAADTAGVLVERIMAEVTFVALLLFSLFLEVRCAWRIGLKRYFAKVCHLLQAVFLFVLALATLLCGIFFADASGSIPDIEMTSASSLGSFRGEKLLELVRQLEVVVSTAAVGVFVGFLLLVDLVRLHEPAHIFLVSLRVEIAQVFFYVVAFLLCLLTFAFAGHWTLGLQWPAFRSFGSSCRSLLEALAGRLDLGSFGPGQSTAPERGLRWEAVIGLVVIGFLFAVVTSMLAFFLLEARRQARRRSRQLDSWRLDFNADTSEDADVCKTTSSLADDNARWLAAAGRRQGWHSAAAAGTWPLCSAICMWRKPAQDSSLKNPFSPHLCCLLASLDSAHLIARLDDFTEASMAAAESRKSQPMLGFEDLVMLLGAGSAADVTHQLLPLLGQPFGGSLQPDSDPQTPARTSSSELVFKEGDARPPHEASTIVAHTDVHAAMVCMRQLSSQVEALTDKLRIPSLTPQAAVRLEDGDSFFDDASDDIGCVPHEMDLSGPVF